MKAPPWIDALRFSRARCFSLLHQIHIGGYSSTSRFPTGGIPDQSGIDSGSALNAGASDTGAAQINSPTGCRPAQRNAAAGRGRLQPANGSLGLAADSRMKPERKASAPVGVVTKITDTARNAMLFTSDETAQQRGEPRSSILHTTGPQKAKL